VVKISEVATGKFIRDVQLSGEGSNPATLLAWSPREHVLAVSPRNKQIRLWNVDSGEMLGILKDDGGAVTALSWLPDAKGLVSLSDDRAIRVWNSQTLQLDGKNILLPVKTGVFSADGRYLLSTSLSYTMRVWDTKTGKPLGTVLALRKQDSQKTLVIAPGGDIRLLPEDVQDDLVAVVQTDAGQEILTLDAFAKRYNWTNNPERVHLIPR
jgi:WD40 repeat protein